MELIAHVGMKIPGAVFDRIRELENAVDTAHRIWQWALPSEEDAALRRRNEAQAALDAARAERLFLGELDLKTLLGQIREDGAPRWFLYPAMLRCKRVTWMNRERVTFEMSGCNHAIRKFPYRNPLFGVGTWTARTIVLPGRIRALVRRYAREYHPHILFEPRDITHRPPPNPDPALIVPAGGKWFLVDFWDDPVVEDPRALNTLREFYIETQDRT